MKKNRFISTLVKTIAILLILTGAVFLILSFLAKSGKIDALSDLVSRLSDGESVSDIYLDQLADSVVAEPVSVESVSYDRYAYQQLDDTTKAVYDQILDCILNHSEKVSLSSCDVDVLANAYEAMMADYGNLFWMNGYQYNTYTSGDTVIGLEFAPKYTMDEEQRSIYQASVDTVADDWLSGISADASDYEKALYVFETLIEKVDYDANSEDNQNILSVFINQLTVCQGYADAAWYLLDKLGIESTVITGTANGEPHAWNLVYLDNAYYYMDVTWGNSKYLNLDNSTEKRVNYAYLAMTTEELMQTHNITVSFEVPECLSNADNYFVHNGLYYDSFDINAIGAAMASSYNSGSAEISLKFGNTDIYTQVLDYFFDQQHISDYCSGISSIYYILDENANVLTIRW